MAVKAAHREGEYQASMAMRGLQEKMAQAMQRADAANSKLAECASLPATCAPHHQADICQTTCVLYLKCHVAAEAVSSGTAIALPPFLSPPFPTKRV